MDTIYTAKKKGARPFLVYSQLICLTPVVELVSVSAHGNLARAVQF